MKLGTQVGLGPGHILLDGDQAPSAHICYGEMAAWIKMSLGMEVGLDAGDFVLDGDLLPLPKRGAEHPSPKFMAHVYCVATKRLDC